MKTEVYKHLKDLRALKMAVEQTIKDKRDSKKFVASVPYTPVALIGEICDNIPSVKDKNLNASIGVFFTVEAAVYLTYLGFTDVTVITDVHDELIASNAQRWGYKYLLIADIEKNNMKFDVIVGNPPYEKGIYKEFMSLAMRLAPEIALITPTTYLSGSKSSAIRRQLADSGVKQINILPRGTFKTVDNDGDKKNVTLCTAVIYIGKNNEPTTISRPIQDHVFSWTFQFTDQDVVLCYDLVGKSIWEQCQKYEPKFDISANSSQGTSVQGPNVNHPEKTHLDVFDLKTDILNTISGAKIFTGLVCDEQGSYVPEGGKRHIYNVDTAEQARNLYLWMTSKLCGLLLTMTGTQHNISNTTLGRIPYIVLDGVYSDDRIYDVLGLTADQRTWITNFGQDEHLQVA